MSEPEIVYVKEKPKTGCLTQVIAAFLLLFLVGFIISLVRESGKPTSSSEPAKPEEPAVEVSELDATRLEYGGMEITGVLKNMTPVSLTRLSIQFSIFDSQDNKIDEASAFIGSLGPGGTWKFRATAGQAGKYRSDGVSCREGRLLVRYLDRELRQRREREAAIERERLVERQKEAAEASWKRAIQRQEESARKTFEFYRQKATNGDGFAQLRLGQLYLAGTGVETNIEQARFWLFCAATNGQKDAVDILQSLQRDH